MADHVAKVKLQLDKSNFIANTVAIENATNSMWRRVAANSSIIGRKIKDWARESSAALRAAFGSDELGRGPFMRLLAGMRALRSSLKSALSSDDLGRGPFMKLLANMRALRTASLTSLKQNTATLKKMFSADEIGRTPYMRLRDAANKLKTESVASLRKRGAGINAAIGPDELGRSPFQRMLTDIHRLEVKSQAAFRRIGEASQRAFAKARTGIGTAGSWLDRGLYGSVKQDPTTGKFGSRGGLMSGLSNFSLTGVQGGPGAMVQTGALFAKDMLSNIYSKGAGIVEDANRVSEAAAQLSVNARGAGQGYIDPKVLEAEAYTVTQQVKGTSAESALEAMSLFTALTGDLKTARSSVATFATVARSTGAGLSDVAASAAMISQQFKITDPEQIKEVLASLTYQGKAGAIELSDLATGLQSLAAGGASFGLSGVQGVKTLGGMTQLWKQGAGSPAETFTAVQATFRQLTAKTKELEQKKVKVYEGKGANKKTRDPTEIIVDAISKLGGTDVAKKATELQGIFGDEGMKGMKPLLALYNETVRNTTGTDTQKQAAGAAALRKAFDEAINAAGGWEDVVQDAAQMQKTSSAQMAAASEALKSKIADNVAPKLTEFATSLSSSTDAIDFFVFVMEAMADTVEGFGKALKALGIIKEHKKTSYELRDEHKAKKEKLQNELKAMQMTPEQIAIAQATDPTGLEEKRKKARELEVQIAGEAAQEKYYNDFANKGGFEWDNDPDNMPVTKTTGRGLKEKFREQQESALEGAQTSKTSPAAAGNLAAQQQAASIERGRQMYLQGPQAPAAAPSGDVKIRDTVRVHVVGDDTSRGDAPQPLPGRYARP